MVVSSVDAVSVEKALLDELLEEDTRKSVIDSCILDGPTVSILWRFVIIPLLYVGRAMAKHDHNAELRIENRYRSNPISL
jgi:hypothetical protein